VQDRVGKHQVETLFKGKRSRIHDLKRQIGMAGRRIAAACQLDHRRGIVHADYRTARQRTGQFRRHFAVAAT
jgi:hypothetical protein